jgi:transposase
LYRIAAKCPIVVLATENGRAPLATTSYLYHAMGLEGYRHLRTEYRDGRIVFHIERTPRKRVCAECGARASQVRLDGRFERTFLGLPVGFKPQEIVLHGHLQICTQCEARVREPIPFADGKSRCLRALGRYIVGMCKVMTIKHVANLLGLSWDVVKDLFKANLEKRHQRRRLGKVRYLAVDEFSTHKGHKYMTTVMDLETGEILHAQEGKDASALIPFLQRLKRAKVPLKAVAMDMSKSYANAVLEVFGGSVDIVHDTFHVVALASKAIDETRKDLIRELHGEDRKVVKGTKFLLLQGMENLKEKSMDRLMNLMVVNEPLYQVYLLKEDLRMFWSLPNEQVGKEFLDQWTTEARATGNKHFAKLADTLDAHRPGLLAYFRHRISTGPMEGTNNKIKVLKRQAYGFRDMEFFKLRLYFLHERSIMMPG